MTSNTNELRKQIVIILKTIATNVHYLNFPKPAVYPYVVYDLHDLGENEGRVSYTVDIDIVARDPYAVTSMADSIIDAIDHKVVSTSKLFFHCYRMTKNSVVEEDKKIQRLHLTAELFLYSKEA